MSPAVKRDFCLLIVTIVAALSWVFSHEAIVSMPPLLFMALRFLIAAGIIGFIARKQFQDLTRENIFTSLKVGCVFAGGMLSFIMGLFYSPHIGEGAFITSLGVVLVPLELYLFWRIKQPLRIWLSLITATFGLGLLSLKQHVHIEIGQLFYVAAAILLAFYFILNNKALHTNKNDRVSTPVMALTTLVLSCVGVMALFLSLCFENWQALLSSHNYTWVSWLLGSATLGTALRFWLLTYAQSLKNDTDGVFILVLEPIWVALMGAYWLHETMSVQQLYGCALIFLALVINHFHLIQKRLRDR